MPGRPDKGNMTGNVLGNKAQTWRNHLGWFQHYELCMQSQAEGLPVDLETVRELFYADPVGLCYDALKVPLSWTNE